MSTIVSVSNDSVMATAEVTDFRTNYKVSTLNSCHRMILDVDFYLLLVEVHITDDSTYQLVVKCEEFAYLHKSVEKAVAEQLNLSEKNLPLVLEAVGTACCWVIFQDEADNDD